MSRLSSLATAITGTLLAGTVASGAAQSQKIGAQPEAENMRLVGHSDLQRRSAYQPTIVHQGSRYIAYIGHHGGTVDAPKPLNSLTGQAEDNGTSIVDVTDPAQPKYLHHIPGEPGIDEKGGAQMARVCAGDTLPRGEKGKYYLLRTFGGSAHEIWDVTDPGNPHLLTRIGGLKGTHKSWWECDTGIAYLVSGASGWRTTRMTQVFDLSDPAHPSKIRDFGLPGQEPGASGPVPTPLHGMMSTGPQGNRIYFGYGTNQGGIVQIVDRDKLIKGPKEPTPDNLRSPVVGQLALSPLFGAHTTYPLGKMTLPEFAKDRQDSARDMIMVVGEQIKNECSAGEARQMVLFVDATDERHPMVVSHYTVPEVSGDFCERGGRFGSHSANESMAPVFFRKLAFVTWFNAGVRAIDIRDPYAPREVGYFIPSITAATEKRCIKIDGQQRCKTAIQSNNAETDDRGYIYLVDRANTGLHILELTGDARKIAGLNP